MTQPLISVVIPNYNGAATLDETLISVRGQSYANLEIILVDDGSRDDSVTRAQHHADVDPRVRIIRQDNAGVAAARNTGWRAAVGDIVAFVDSDDLWAVDKIERQAERMLRADEPGLVYCGYAMIDRDSRILEREPCADHEGWVLDRLVVGNFIGNGSAVMVRRWVLEKTRGFESALHHARAQGCEDLLFYCRAAEHCRFGAVPDHLVGYRTLPDNMSSDGRRMLRSWRMVIDEIGDRHPDRLEGLERGFGYFAAWTARRSLFQRQPMMVARILTYLASVRPRLAAHILFLDLPRAVRRSVRNARHRRRAGLSAAASTPAQDKPRYPIGATE